MTTQERDSYGLTEGFMRSRALVFLFLLALNFVAHHIHFRDFGLRGEDYTYAMQGLGKDPLYVFTLFSDAFFELTKGSLGVSGRILGLLSTYALAATGWMAGGLPGAHLISWLLSAACSYILYRAFAQRGDFFHGFAAALFLALYPAYVVRQYLTTQLLIIPSLIFTLLAIKSLMAGKRILPYALAACSLFTYESPVFAFLGAPLLLDVKWDLRMARRLVVHLTIMAGMIAVVLWLRTAYGEGRTVDLLSRLSEMPARIAASVFYGTIVSAVYSSYYAAIQLTRSASVHALLIALVAVPIFSYILYTGSRRIADDGGNALYLKRAVAGLVSVALSHAVPYVTPVSNVSDATLRIMDSRVHAAASFGTAIFLSSVFIVLLRLTGRGRRRDLARLAAASATAVFLAVLTGYAYNVQSDFRPGWLFQRCIWTKVITEAPDMDDDDLILIDARKLADSKNLHESDRPYELKATLPAVYEFPSDWKEKPMIAFIPHDWDEKTAVRQNNDKTEIKIASLIEPEWTPLESGNLIYFTAYRKELTRVDGATTFSGREVRLKPKPAAGAVLQPLEKGFLFDSVFDPGCSFAGIAGAKPPRDIEGAPMLSRTLHLDGAKEVRAHLPGGGKVERFTIELWLRSGGNTFGGKGVIDERFPPMPAIIGPLRLDHWAEESMLFTMTGKERNIVYEVRDVFGSGKDARWVHVELDANNIKHEATLFINGRIEKKFSGADIPLKGPFVLGNGYLTRFWQGELADLRISSVVRHTEDFEPEKTSITRDKHTLYFMDDK